MSSGPRLFVALGPGDIVGARRAQRAGEAIHETSIAFSEQLFAYCRLRGIRTLAISSNGRADTLQEGLVGIENRGKPLAGHAGVRFHLSQILYGLYLAIRARRFGADVAVIDSGTTHYFTLMFFRLLGIPVAVNLHNVLWPRGFPPQGRLQRTIRLLNSLFFRYACAGAIGVSPECERQVVQESRGKVPFFQYRCQFKLAGFRASRRPIAGVFRIAFVGRAEANKGVLDIPRMVQGLRSRAPVKVIFEVCGDGPALPELKSIVGNQQLGDEIIVHGRLERDALLEVYARSDAVIVPTRSNFTEGMPQVCAEAVLSGIPVITSEVANAFDVIGPAAVNARTDDAESYVDVIVSLIGDPALYERLRAACPALAPQFLDRSQSYPAALDRLLEMLTGRPRLADHTDIFAEIA
jgi:glycosyltransferase involved in cell wall biosynthesis